MTRSLSSTNQPRTYGREDQSRDKMQAAGACPDKRRVPIAQYLFDKKAANWWEAVATRDCTTTWVEFKAAGGRVRSEADKIRYLYMHVKPHILWSVDPLICTTFKECQDRDLAVKMAISKIEASKGKRQKTSGSFSEGHRSELLEPIISYHSFERTPHSFDQPKSLTHVTSKMGSVKMLFNCSRVGRTQKKFRCPHVNCFKCGRVGH
ncbi:hypothetical protein OROMI_014632 [Orobanche minor]